MTSHVTSPDFRAFKYDICITIVKVDLLSTPSGPLFNCKPNPCVHHAPEDGPPNQRTVEVRPERIIGGDDRVILDEIE